MSDKNSNVRLVDEHASDAEGIDQKLISGLEVMLEARVGSARLKVSELMKLKSGDKVPLDAALNEDVELRLNGVTIARGELVAIGSNFGVRIVEIVK